MLKKELVFVLCYFISPFLCSAAWRWLWQLEPILNPEPYPREWWCHDLRISWSRISGCSWTSTWQKKKPSSWLSHFHIYIYIYTHTHIIYIHTYILHIHIYIYTYIYAAMLTVGFPWWLSSKRICLPMQEIQDSPVWSLGWEDPLEEEMATHSSILAWKIPWTRNLVGYSPQSCQELDMTERLSSTCTMLTVSYPRVTNKLICSPHYKFISLKSYIIMFTSCKKYLKHKLKLVFLLYLNGR